MDVRMVRSLSEVERFVQLMSPGSGAFERRRGDEDEEEGGEAGGG